MFRYTFGRGAINAGGMNSAFAQLRSWVLSNEAPHGHGNTELLRAAASRDFLSALQLDGKAIAESILLDSLRGKKEARILSEALLEIRRRVPRLQLLQSLRCALDDALRYVPSAEDGLLNVAPLCSSDACSVQRASHCVAVADAVAVVYSLAALMGHRAFWNAVAHCKEGAPVRTLLGRFERYCEDIVAGVQPPISTEDAMILCRILEIIPKSEDAHHNLPHAAPLLKKISVVCAQHAVERLLPATCSADASQKLQWVCRCAYSMDPKASSIVVRSILRRALAFDTVEACVFVPGSWRPGCSFCREDDGSGFEGDHHAINNILRLIAVMGAAAAVSFIKIAQPHHNLLLDRDVPFSAQLYYALTVLLPYYAASRTDQECLCLLTSIKGCFTPEAEVRLLVMFEEAGPQRDLRGPASPTTLYLDRSAVLQYLLLRAYHLASCLRLQEKAKQGRYGLPVGSRSSPLNDLVTSIATRIAAWEGGGRFWGKLQLRDSQCRTDILPFLSAADRKGATMSVGPQVLRLAALVPTVLPQSLIKEMSKNLLDENGCSVSKQLHSSYLFASRFYVTEHQKHGTFDHQHPSFKSLVDLVGVCLKLMFSHEPHSCGLETPWETGARLSTMALLSSLVVRLAPFGILALAANEVRSIYQVAKEAAVIEPQPQSGVANVRGVDDLPPMLKKEEGGTPVDVWARRERMWPFVAMTVGLGSRVPWTDGAAFRAVLPQFVAADGHIKPRFALCANLSKMLEATDPTPGEGGSEPVKLFRAAFIEAALR